MKYISTLLLCLFIGGPMMAQNIQIFDSDGNDVTNSTYTYIGEPDAKADVAFTTTNVSGFTMEMGLKRVETNVPSGTKNYFCWFECYFPTNTGVNYWWDAPDSVLLDNDSTFYGMHAYHWPEGQASDATYRYIWYDQNNPTDSVFVDIVFNQMPLSSNELTVFNAELKAWPNPGKDVVSVAFNANTSKELSLVVRNLLGTEVSRQTLHQSYGTVRMDTGTLPDGIYLISLQDGTNRLKTVRHVVAN